MNGASSRPSEASAPARRLRRSFLLPLGVTAAVALWCGVPTPAQAQSSSKKEELVPPTPGKEDANRPVILTYLATMVVVAAVVGVNAIPSKRGHQD